MPQNKMERFTQRARRVLSLSLSEAEVLGHRSVGTGHLLLGLVVEDQGLAGHVLRDLKIDDSMVRPIVVELLKADEGRQGAFIDVSPDAKHTLELAVSESRRLGHNYIGTEHLLLAILQQPDSTAFTILERLNADVKLIEKHVIRALRREERSVLRPGMKPVSSLIQRRFVNMMPPAAIPNPPMNVEVMKILQMIDEGKVTAEEGERLIKLIVPGGLPPARTDRYIQLDQFQAEGDNRQLRAVITDKSKGETEFYISMPIQGAEDGLKNALSAIQNGLTGILFTVESDEYRIDLYVDKPADEEAS